MPTRDEITHQRAAERDHAVADAVDDDEGTHSATLLVNGNAASIHSDWVVHCAVLLGALRGSLALKMPLSLAIYLAIERAI